MSYDQISNLNTSKILVPFKSEHLKNVKNNLHVNNFPLFTIFPIQTIYKYQLFLNFDTFKSEQLLNVNIFKFEFLTASYLQM